MKDPIFLSSPIYPPILPSKLSLSTIRDDHLIPTLSQQIHVQGTIDFSLNASD